MKRTGLVLGVMICLILNNVCLGQGTFNGWTDNAKERAREYEEQGKFQEAVHMLGANINHRYASENLKKELYFGLDRLDRIKKDFPYTKEDLFTELKKSVKGLTQEEFDKWVLEGRFDSREIDGKRYFMGSSVSNLFFRYPELNPRRIPPKDTAANDKAVLETIRAIKKAAAAEKKPYVLPKHFHVTMTVTAKSNAAPDGKVIRAWLPIPRSYPFQTDFKFLKASSPVKHLDDETSPIRAVYLEQPARKDKPTEFKIEYDYTEYGVHFEMSPGDVKPLTPSLSPSDGERVSEGRVRGDLSTADLKKFTSEAPHVVFTPEMRELSDKIAGTEKNPLLKAKAFYDWIGENIKYSYAIEYSTIHNISDYCRSRGYGDCGQEALLFITLCRLNGIPARWQTGWNTFPNAKSIHDWCEIYIAPYGWIPVDPYKSIWAMRYATTLTPEQKREARDFYFGGLDQYRMAANSDHSKQLTPPKNSFRSDDVDFQRGELEYDDKNIYFDQYSYSLIWTELGSGKSAAEPSKEKTFRR